MQVDLPRGISALYQFVGQLVKFQLQAECNHIRSSNHSNFAYIHGGAITQEDIKILYGSTTLPNLRRRNLHHSFSSLFPPGVQAYTIKYINTLYLYKSLSLTSKQASNPKLIQIMNCVSNRKPILIKKHNPKQISIPHEPI